MTTELEHHPLIIGWPCPTVAYGKVELNFTTHGLHCINGRGIFGTDRRIVELDAHLAPYLGREVKVAFYFDQCIPSVEWIGQVVRVPNSPNFTLDKMDPSVYISFQQLLRQHIGEEIHVEVTPTHTDAHTLFGTIGEDENRVMWLFETNPYAEELQSVRIVDAMERWGLLGGEWSNMRCFMRHTHSIDTQSLFARANEAYTFQTQWWRGDDNELVMGNELALFHPRRQVNTRTPPVNAGLEWLLNDYYGFDSPEMFTIVIRPL